MYRICGIALVILVVNASAQQSTDISEGSTCGYSELYRKDGWLVPGLDGAKKKTARAAVPGRPGVYLTILEPAKREASIEVFECSRTDVGRLEIADVRVGVGEIYAFDDGVHVFAYGVVYGVDGIGVVWHVVFYDMDGSGHFSLRRSERNRIVPDLIPDWVKNNSANPQQ